MNVTELLKDKAFYRAKCRWFLASKVIRNRIVIYIGTTTSFPKSAFYRLLKKTYPNENYKDWRVTRVSDIALDNTRICLENGVDLQSCYRIATYEILNCIDNNRDKLYNEDKATNFKVESLSNYFYTTTENMTELYYIDKYEALNSIAKVIDITKERAWKKFLERV